MPNLLPMVNNEVMETIPLPYIMEYDDGDKVDVYIRRQDGNRPVYEMTFAPTGPASFTILGFGKEQLLQLANFIQEIAEVLE